MVAIGHRKRRYGQQWWSSTYGVSKLLQTHYCIIDEKYAKFTVQNVYYLYLEMYVENSHQKYLWMLTFVFLLKLVLGGTVQYESFYLCHVYLHQTKCFWTIDVPKFIKLMYGYTLSIWCNITLVVPCLNPTCNLSCWKMYNRIVPSRTWQEPILVYLRCCKKCIYYQPV